MLGERRAVEPALQCHELPRDKERDASATCRGVRRDSSRRFGAAWKVRSDMDVVDFSVTVPPVDVIRGIESVRGMADRTTLEVQWKY